MSLFVGLIFVENHNLNNNAINITCRKKATKIKRQRMALSLLQLLFVSLFAFFFIQVYFAHTLFTKYIVSFRSEWITNDWFQQTWRK